MQRDGNSITQEELSRLPAEVQSWYSVALGWAENATNAWHAGVAHGLILGLERAGLVTDASTLDRLSKATLKALPPGLFDGIPESEMANLGKDLARPAAPSTQRRRQTT